MSDESKKKPEPKGAIDAFRIVPQSFGRLSVVAHTLATGGLPQEAFKPSGAQKSSKKHPPARR